VNEKTLQQLIRESIGEALARPEHRREAFAESSGLAMSQSLAVKQR
jgi:hypothetical protein